ncbi:hypothetical protein [Sphaerospermopsis aphanizomenoides]|uniref:hypothetical protein n=1 Tax=Sphaerospermopsis aphanizomenoides TaxID=459663 RepID=UPI001881271C|nr:hypothetical protein [Sphaerospermopsis aphanizomenoides]
MNYPYARIRFSVTSCVSPNTHYQLPITHYQLPITNYQLPTDNLIVKICQT